MESYFVLYIFSGSVKLLTCLTIVFFALGAVFTYLSWKAQVQQAPHKNEPAPPNLELFTHNLSAAAAPKLELKEEVKTAPVPEEKVVEPPQIKELESQNELLKKSLSEMEEKLSILLENTKLKSRQHSATEKTAKTLFKSYQNLLKRYEEAQKAHHFELKTLFKNAPQVQSTEISSLLTFHRLLKAPEEQLYFLLSLIQMADEKMDSSMMQSLSALQNRRRLKILESYNDLPWLLLQINSGKIEGASRACVKYGLTEKELADPISREHFEDLRTIEPYELFELSIGQSQWVGLSIDAASSEALLVCRSPKMSETALLQPHIQ